MKYWSFLFFSSLFQFIALACVAQPDSLVMKNGDIMEGEIKSLYHNVLTIETDYSDEDFKIEWDGIKEVFTSTYFLITLTDGSRLNGYLVSVGADTVNIHKDDGSLFRVHLIDIVMLDDLDKGFWNQLYASIDLGFDLTKSNNFRQLSVRSNLGYMAKRWQLDGTYNSLFSRQDSTEDILRRDGGVMYKYFLPNDWYPLASVEFLANTEQDLKLRTISKLGMGKYLIHTNRMYWGISAGVNYNNERYSTDSIPERNSMEGFFGTEVNFFNIGDLDLITRLIVYPGVTEYGRWRTDFVFDMKYDLPLDFYIKVGFTLNYDNQPAAGFSESDYVLHSGFGWEW